MGAILFETLRGHVEVMFSVIQCLGGLSSGDSHSVSIRPISSYLGLEYVCVSCRHVSLLFSVYFSIQCLISKSSSGKHSLYGLFYEPFIVCKSPPFSFVVQPLVCGKSEGSVMCAGKSGLYCISLMVSASTLLVATVLVVFFPLCIFPQIQTEDCFHLNQK